MRATLRKPIGATISAAAVIAVTAAVVISTAVNQSLANLWVDSSGGTCTRVAGSGGAYADASACGSLNAAYAAASAGDRILIKSGSYGSETIANRSLPGSRVTIESADGETVSFTDIVWQADLVNLNGPIKFRTLNIGDLTDPAPVRTNDVTFDNIEVDHQDSTSPTRRAMMIGATDDVTVSNFNIHNTMAGSVIGEDSNLVQTLGGTDIYNTDLIFDTGRFHDNDTPTTTAAHNECMYVVDVSPFTVRNVDFESCTYYGIFLTDFNNGGVETGDSMTIENNVFRQGKTEGGSGYFWGIGVHPQIDETPFTNAVIRNNTFEHGLALGFTGTASNASVRNNIIGTGAYSDDASSAQCKTSVTFAYNVMPFACGSNTTVETTTNIRADFVSQNSTWGASEDFHLVSGAAAIGAGDPGSFTASDRDGVVRSSPPEAGAYEFVGGGNASPSVSVTAPSNGATVSGTNTTISATASDTDGTVSSVQFKIDGSDFGPPDTSSPFTTTWNTTSVADGSHSITAVATDDDSATTTSSAVSVTVSNGGGGAPTTANIFVENGAGTCAGGRSSTLISYASSASPDRRCGSFDQANDAMNSGDIAIVKAGTYTAGQLIDGDKTSLTRFYGEGDGDDVQITGVASGPIGGSWCNLCIDANFVSVENLTTVTDDPGPYGSVGTFANDVRIVDVDMFGAVSNFPNTGDYYAPSMGVEGLRTTVIRGNIGRPTAVQMVTCNHSTIEPIWVQSAGDDFLMDGTQVWRYDAYTHPTQIGPCGVDRTPHVETIRFEDADGATLQNGTFHGPTDAGSGHIFTSSDPDNTEFINWTFEDRGLGNGVFQSNGGTGAGWTLAHNTFLDSGGWTTAGESGFSLTGNFGYQPMSSGTHVKNVFAGSGSSGTNTYIGSTAFNLDSNNEPNAGSPAVNAAESSGGSSWCPGTDALGRSRPVGAACDAGAYERP